LTKRLVVLLVLAIAATAAAPASADGSKLSIGYAYLKSLEEGGGSVPTGGFVSFAPGDDSGIELDFGYHKDDDVNNFTGGLGIRFPLGSGESVQPFVHVLGAASHVRFSGQSDTDFGGIAGIGMDLGLGSSSMMIRLGADLQVFFDGGDNYKRLRLGVGLTF
jgi:hypothetical protein